MVFGGIGKAIIDISTRLLMSYSYAALFVIAIASSSTIFLPVPFAIVVFLAPLPPIGMNPLLVGIVAGAGSTIGEFTSYFLGAGSKAVIEKRRKKETFVKLTKFFKKYGFIALAVTAFIPFPFDAVGITAGMSAYDVRKFFLATLMGKIPKFVLIAYSGLFATPYLHTVADWLVKSIF